MVRSAKQGGGYKNAYVLGTISLIYFKLDQDVGEGVPYHFTPMTSWGVHGAPKMASELQGCILCIIFLPKPCKQGKIQPGMFLCVLDVHFCITVIQYFPPLFIENKSSLRSKSSLHSLLPPCCEMRSFTQVYNFKIYSTYVQSPCSMRFRHHVP